MTRKAAYRAAAKEEFYKANDRCIMYTEADIAEIAAELMDADDIEMRNKEAFE